MAGGRFDPDGDVNMDAGPTVPQPIYEVVRPPKLVSWNIPRSCLTGEVFERVVATVKGAIQPEVLHIISSYILQRPLEAITDNDVPLSEREVKLSSMSLFLM
ncbi:hypothetical protein PHMEG_00032251 [Phytophthora megakarya]|uniref:Uncharacterized protein n=1 Tax=Phytophthora megakarya TaxID=4795 RepID=A0A225UWD3_9STRA|nr:hypothetical protein PHMEG_00032251 [Phytophthora megakarya]